MGECCHHSRQHRKLGFEWNCGQPAHLVCRPELCSGAPKQRYVRRRRGRLGGIEVNGDGFGPEAMIPFGIIGGLAWVLIVVGAVLLVIWAVRAFAAQPSIRSAGAPLQSVSVESPLYILERRFALGEIGADEFEKARALLRDEGATT